MVAMIFVTGATGNVGGELVRALVDAGRPVRALVRDDAARARLPAGADAVLGDLSRPETFAHGLEGVSALYLLAGYEGLAELLAAARDAGAERAVLQSSSSVPGGDVTNAVARYHLLSEQAVRESGLRWTFLQPNSFMSNALQWREQLQAGDTIRAPFADVRVASIDPSDIAAVAAAALTSDEHAGRSYRLSGPESHLPVDRVAVLARVLGRDLRFEAQSDDEARAEMTAAMPAEYVDAFFSFFVDGALDESEVLPAVQDVTGRPPRTFERWARAHADAFSPPPSRA
jgi:uncharacterized protein YbjT (DUF2867 family)